MGQALESDFKSLKVQDLPKRVVGNTWLLEG